jgi:VWFA-related protein
MLIPLADFPYRVGRRYEAGSRECMNKRASASVDSYLVFVLGIALFGAAVTAAAQDAPVNPASAVPAPANSGAAASEQVPVVKATTRLVSLEVVARDRQGRPIPGLTAKDFEISEQLLPKKDHHPQTISVFKAVDWADLKSAKTSASQLPAGVYSNLLDSQKVQIPPTVLLFDGINTDLPAQLEVHRQMLGILKSIPEQVPVAVFLMGDRLRLLQTFTTDPKLVREAVAKTLAPGHVTNPDQDPTDDPNALSASLENISNLPAGFLASVENFEQQTYWFNISVRMQKTLDVFRDLAHYLDGYPGRKNILWISTSFPLELAPSGDPSTPNFANLNVFQGEMQDVGTALMDGKIAIYPVDAGGVRTQTMFDASTRVRQPNNGARMGQAIQREDTLRQSSQQVMRDLADETGGRVCLGDNDFADCVKKAVDDASSYYELAYYPSNGDWKGEFHRITIKTTHPGTHLWYREGYFARPLAADSGSSEQQANAAIQKAGCQDPLPSTAILLMIRVLPPDQPGAAKYFLAIDPKVLTFGTPSTGEHVLDTTLAACTFDKTGKPMQYYTKASRASLNEEQFATASHGVTETFQFMPQPGTARVRLLVRDSASGRIGSVDIPYGEAVAPSNASSTPANP